MSYSPIWNALQQRDLQENVYDTSQSFPLAYALRKVLQQPFVPPRICTKFCLACHGTRIADCVERKPFWDAPDIGADALPLCCCDEVVTYAVTRAMPTRFLNRKLDELTSGLEIDFTMTYWHHSGKLKLGLPRGVGLKRKRSPGWIRQPIVIVCVKKPPSEPVQEVCEFV